MIMIHVKPGGGDRRQCRVLLCQPQRYAKRRYEPRRLLLTRFPVAVWRTVSPERRQASPPARHDDSRMQHTPRALRSRAPLMN
eukprot:CAMPEP_0174739294 /NCGR_PEP_ID=MMETSP1094-20130205/71329_1 /TAXON_ID=156173 /ORGANISM="Chrysochromulina brevifilum, Strain UTEX LB 985" /LENGTH=82 /DNA_ID=CAMNT_0015942837 /DNA_START=317 /DNA_END=565 /DNA_ORIENTATION=+